MSRVCPACREVVPYKPRPEGWGTLPGRTCAHCADPATNWEETDAGDKPSCGRDHCRIALEAYA